ncbi:relaxase/mobilization nuclease domain-containing protein [Pleurocapsales cyanobacterium LEGE 06147]|nr:relaxase/mobilization nuclease domain-containing protein [Pleurocapsales cyanobacterium LEGE 06147]
MIAKQVQGSDFQKVLNYVHNKSGARLIGSNMTGKDPESLTEEFRMSSDLRKRVSKCVYHVSLSVSPSEKLSERVWMKIARAYLNGMEFNGNQYAIYRHTDREHDHIHIIASRIRITDGSVVSDSWNYRRSEKLVMLLEQQFGLSQTPCSWKKNKRSPTTGEIRRQRRTGEVNKRSQLQTLIQQSLQDSPSLDQFIGRLTARGVSVRLRKSKEGKIEGISYGLDGVAFQGRQLGRDYSWTSLELLLAKETSYQFSQNHVIAQQDVIASGATELVAVTTIVAENQDTEDNKLEQQKKQLRAKYAHDAITRWLHRLEPNAEELWHEAKELFISHQSPVISHQCTHV